MHTPNPWSYLTSPIPVLSFCKVPWTSEFQKRGRTVTVTAGFQSMGCQAAMSPVFTSMVSWRVGFMLDCWILGRFDVHLSISILWGRASEAILRGSTFQLWSLLPAFVDTIVQLYIDIYVQIFNFHFPCPTDSDPWISGIRTFRGWNSCGTRWHSCGTWWHSGVHRGDSWSTSANFYQMQSSWWGDDLIARGVSIGLQTLSSEQR